MRKNKLRKFLYARVFQCAEYMFSLILSFVQKFVLIERSKKSFGVLNRDLKVYFEYI